MNREESIIGLYVTIDAACEAVTKGQKLRQRGPNPDLTDAEILTIEIFGEMQGHHDDASIWRYAGFVVRAIDRRQGLAVKNETGGTAHRPYRPTNPATRQYERSAPEICRPEASESPPPRRNRYRPTR